MNLTNHTMEVRAAKLGYGHKVIAPQLDLVIDKPEVISIIGPNGSGKSTLLKALSRLLPPLAGTVLLDGKDIYSLPPREVARIMAILPQTVHAPGDMTVNDLVSYGRMPYKKMFEQLATADQACMAEALAATGMQAMQHCRLDSLSGGERQRAWLAMALAQQPRLLLLDEPTTYLDLHHQLELMKLVRKLHQDRQLTVVMVLHDLNHAARFSQRIIAVKDGRIFADGSIKEVFTAENLRSLYGVETTVMTVEQGGSSHLVCFPHDTCLAPGA
ncbi:ABC transporter ATP-binding protein [Sporomusa sphaeroides]|uniref:Siderophore transport system ATP-binding protein YusV n=2 Tax=Sporomusa TaxID=2375 RepID=A0ABM9W4K8_9FIRM|nr:ABC transporter ATP-binding protein [Sporomusa sphaeroides]OLS56081.1 putative siderophore transport system ATP-binding protein YusV [Sporomusa sphaeroides DSM 2875]CVK19277.1 putative siderophore transport system ATP-binding protein YusV [Sporomusa sphaeroides DSM 2875]SCM82670.1 iron-enterobactin transporter subunit; ATP-binding component of ABC superfamily [uncultured Sporomusa sp.]